MLVPNLEFRLTAVSDAPLDLEHLFLGPSPNISIFMSSLELYLVGTPFTPGRASATAGFRIGSAN
jgi:hypothetical protein